MSGVTFDDGVASQYLTPNTWWKWLLTGKLEITEKEGERKAYLVTLFQKHELGDVAFKPASALLEENKLKLFDKKKNGEELKLEGYRWSKPGEFNGRNALLVIGLVSTLGMFFFARKV